MTSGVAVSGISVPSGQWRYYCIPVPSGATNLNVTMTGSGDVDLYTRFGSAPTGSSYACRPYLSGSSESCSQNNPSAGTWWIGLWGYSGGTVTLAATVTGGSSPTPTRTPTNTSTPGTPTATNTPTNTPAATNTATPGGACAKVISSASPVTGIPVPQGQWRYYCITVPAGAMGLTIGVTGTGDIDLYTRFGSAPTGSSYACRPYLSGSTETCQHNNPATGTWWVGLYGYSGGTVTLTATLTLSGGCTLLTSGVPLAGVQVNAGQWKYFCMSVPAGSTHFSANVFGSGDIDLYTRFGAAPGLSTYDCRPYFVGSSEWCEHAAPSGGTWWIGLYGYAAGTETVSGRTTASASCTTISSGVSVRSISLDAAQWKYFCITVLPGATNLTVTMTDAGGVGDVDLYTRYATQPTLATYDCSPFLVGSNETCLMASPSAGTWWIGLNGFAGGIVNFTAAVN
jgi:hypothetical protein